MRAFLILLYPVLIVACVLNRLLGRDPLRLRKPEGNSYWKPRVTESDLAAYFSESSPAEGNDHGGFGWIALRPFCVMGQLFRPRDRAIERKTHATLDREQDIPDEVYTLW